MTLTEKPRPTDADAAAKAAADEQRFARRKPCQLVAEVRTSPKAVPMPCLVRDMSSTGALVDIGQGRSETFAATPKLPNEFTLVIRRDFTEVDCRVMWRKGMLMGVRYTSPVRLLPRPPKSALPQRSAVDKMLDQSPVVQNARKIVKAVRL